MLNYNASATTQLQRQEPLRVLVSLAFRGVCDQLRVQFGANFTALMQASRQFKCVFFYDIQRRQLHSCLWYGVFWRYAGSGLRLLSSIGVIDRIGVVIWPEPMGKVCMRYLGLGGSDDRNRCRCCRCCCCIRAWREGGSAPSTEYPGNNSLHLHSVFFWFVTFFSSHFLWLLIGFLALFEASSVFYY